MGLRVHTTGGAAFTLECVDAATLKAAIEAGDHQDDWLPVEGGGSVLGAAIVAIGAPEPPPDAESLAKQEQRRRIDAENKRRRDAGLPPDDDPLE